MKDILVNKDDVEEVIELVKSKTRRPIDAMALLIAALHKIDKSMRNHGATVESLVDVTSRALRELENDV